MLPKNWQPQNSYNLVRVGSQNDGGYVIPRTILKRTDTLFGLGVCTDWSFEEEFQNNSGCRVLCYDHSITNDFWKNRFKADLKKLFRGRIRKFSQIKEMFKFLDYRKFFNNVSAVHYQKMVGYQGPNSVSIKSMLETNFDKNVFLKIDIEGSEYEILNDLVVLRDQLLGFVIEFHQVDAHRDTITRFIDDLSGFRVVHVHSNNYGGVDANGDPKVIEITFINDSLVRPDHIESVTEKYPVEGLDFPNNPLEADIPLRFQS